MLFFNMEFLKDHNAYISRLRDSLSKISDIDLAKKRLTYIRWKVCENLDRLLFEFETNVKKTDAGILWCPDVKSSMDNLNKHIRNFQQVKFFPHSSVRHFVNELDINLPEPNGKPEVVVIGAKFLMANTGNFYCALNSFEEYETIIQAKKIVVIAGIDTFLSVQSELPLAKQLYATFETGNLSYPAEFIGRPGRIRGLNCETVLLLTDNHKSKLLEIPNHRPLFSLLNFDLPPVCPMQQLSYQPFDWKKQDTLAYLLYGFMHGLEAFPQHITGNYGLELINQYLPYDIDLYDQVLDARALLHADDKKSRFSTLLDTDRSAILFHPKKFKDPEKFRKFASHNFFGKHDGL
jgi:hypothetical protein